ncbi:MAG: twin-arginine translocase subunit TatC [Planctomycetes bacterium]|nr:twin-arginine translocase subunit TatC [Planctomycetota bacterium]
MTAKDLEPDDVRMTFGEHLEELRWRLIKATVAWLICFIGAAFLYLPLLEFICRPHFLAMSWLNKPEETQRLLSGGYAKPIFAVLKLAFIVSVAAASPAIAWQIWRFVAGGLYKNERRYVKLYALPSLLLFIGGCAFGYFILIPFGLYGMASMLNFDFIAQQYLLQDYLDLVMTLTIVTGAIFELPLIMMFTTSIGVTEPKTFWRWSRYAIVAIFLAAAILTPSPDVVTQLLMAGPLTVLYFFGMGLSYLVRRRP